MKKKIICLLLCVAGCVTEEVEPSPTPVAAFTVSVAECFAPCEISFTNTSQNADTYSWDFNDGNTATETSPGHTYETGGAYHVKLTAKGDGGTADSTQQVIVRSIAWDKSYGYSSSELLSSVTTTSDGGFLLGGESSSPLSGNKAANHYGGRDYWVVKTDGAGNKQWDKSFGGSSADYLRTVLATPDSGFLLGGSSSSSSSGNKTSPPFDRYDFWVVKIK